MAVGRRDGRTGQDVLRRVGEASVLVLISLADGPKHGYALIRDIKELAGVELGPGTLYGALDRLERLGLIESLPADDRRHPYRITAPGAAALRVHLDSLERLRDRAAVLSGPLAAAARRRGRRAGRAAHQGRDPGRLDRLELPGRRSAGVAHAAPRPALEHGGLRAAGRGLLAGRLGGAAGAGGAGQGGQHGPGARVRALPAWPACARSGRDPRHGPPAVPHLGSHAWPILLTQNRSGPDRAGAGGRWLRRPS